MNEIVSVLSMLRVNPDLANDRDKMQRSPLFWAAKRNYEHLLNIFLDYDADIHEMDHLGRTP